jgi:hypothetical protein
VCLLVDIACGLFAKDNGVAARSQTICFVSPADTVLFSSTRGVFVSPCEKISRQSILSLVRDALQPLGVTVSISRCWKRFALHLSVLSRVRHSLLTNIGAFSSWRLAARASGRRWRAQTWTCWHSVADSSSFALVRSSRLTRLFRFQGHSPICRVRAIGYTAIAASATGPAATGETLSTPFPLAFLRAC